MMQTTQKDLVLDKIRIDGGTQPRVKLNQDLVTEYAEAIREGANFPPVDVFYDGTDYWLGDGFHRYHGYRGAEKTKIPATIRNGTQRDAVLFSCGANPAHGLRRSNADKRKAVTTLLEDPEWATWSNNEIARRCHVGHPLVAEIRADLTRSSSSENGRSSGKTRKFTNKHGGESEMKTANIGGKKPDPSPPEPDHPDEPNEPTPEPETESELEVETPPEEPIIEREPGDETEHEPPHAPVARPLPRSKRPNTEKLEKQVGAAIRVVDRLAEVVGGHTGTSQAILAKFGELKVLIDAWKKGR